MKTFEIMFSDLTPEAQQAYVEFFGEIDVHRKWNEAIRSETAQ